MSKNVSVGQGRVGAAFRALLAAGTLAAGLAFAPGAMAGWYFGANYGPMMIDLPGVDDPNNVGLVVGREWGVVVGDVGVQGEFTTSIDDGLVAGQAVSVDTQALYGVVRTAGPIYLIAKAGVLREEVTMGAASETDTGGSVGLGVGFSLGVVKLELQYTLVDEDISYLSLGARF